MTCEDCTRTRAGLWCGYSASCLDCTARAIARSLPAFNALHNRGTGNRHGRPRVEMAEGNPEMQEVLRRLGAA